MPERATRALSAVPFHQEKRLRAVGKFHEREKRAIPKEGGHHFPGHCKTHIWCPPFGLAEQTAAPNCSQREWLSTTCCLCLSGEKRQEVGECHEYQNKTHPETILSRCSATAKKWAWDSSAKSLVDTMHVIITWSGLSISNFCNKQFPYSIKKAIWRGPTLATDKELKAPALH